MDKELLLILIMFTLANIQNQWTQSKEHEAELNILRDNIAMFSAQEKSVVEFEYKYNSPMHKLDKLTSPFGYRELLNPFTGGVTTGSHKGVDIVGNWHCEIMPIDPDGVVIDKWVVPNGTWAEGHEIFGAYVRIQHKDGWISGYGHMSTIYVREGDVLHDGVFYHNGKRIGSEGIIGRQGNTGMSTGEHLHLSIQKPDGSFVDPLRWVEL